MAEIGYSIAAKLIEVIGSAVIKDICNKLGYRSELDELNKTVITIKEVLLEAESRCDLTINEQAYIEDLKAAVYDADDLFDEFLTLAELKQLDSGKNVKFTKKVRNFFSLKKKEVTQAYRMSRQVKEIKENLDAVVARRKYFLSFDTRPIREKKREETDSFLYKEKVIVGRDDDFMNVKGMLLGPNVNEDIRFLSIVGVGGMGKTTLAKLVYNDEEIENKFHPSLRLWVHVSDQEGEKFDVRKILCKILELVPSDEKLDGNSSMELVQKQFEKQLGGKKYLLVLDDLWNEDRRKWLNLENLLMSGQEGSRIMITTRSKTTTTIIGNKLFYELKALSQKDSWSLFETLAFDKEHEDIDYLEKVEIGKNVVEKCYNTPLAIEVVGSLLYGRDISKWRSFEKSGLAEIDSGRNNVMSILKLSYYNLESSLKNCFSYCALFPKNSIIQREMLISLWIAQGYIVPFDRGQSIEDAAKEHFLTLLGRCFFQDVKRDYYGVVESIKIHDLMHDVALVVRQGEIGVLSSISKNLGDKTRHLYYAGDASQLGSFHKSKIRSFVTPRYVNNLQIHSQLDHLMCLRVMSLCDPDIRILPHSIGKLLHLRYLNLTGSRQLETLSVITELHNLETLILRYCFSLMELPKDFSKLVKLRHLDLDNCRKFTSMPSNMDKLTSLRVLPYFVVGKGSNEKQCDGKLEDLKALTNLRGKLCVEIGGNYRSEEVMNDSGGGGYLQNTKHLKELFINFWGCVDDFQEEVLDKLEPHPNIKGIILKYYHGRRIPCWGKAFCFPNLVKIKFRSCSNLEQLPSLSELPHLKSLKLRMVEKLEYMENRRSRSNTRLLFFPSLESLKICNLESLKGWWREEELVDDNDDDMLRMMTFPRLSTLDIYNCPNLKSFPPCRPTLQNLVLGKNNSALKLSINKRDKAEEDEDSTEISQYDVPPLISLSISDVDHFKMTVGSISEMETEENIVISWKSLNLTLRHLGFSSLKGRQVRPIVANGMQYLTSLQTLQFSFCQEMEALPEWIGNLSSLEHLKLYDCGALKSLPESLRSLTSLKTLDIFYCPKLNERCKKPDGEDWPNIQHIHHLTIDLRSFD